MAKPRSDAIDSEVARAVISGAAGRMRAHRERKASGRVVLRVEVDGVAVEELLIDAGYLAAWDTDDRKRVEAAFAKWIAAQVVCCA